MKKNNKGQFINGNIPWNRGKRGVFKHSKEWKIRMSKLKKGKRPYKMTSKIKNKISEALRGEKNPNFRRIFPKEQRIKISQGLKGNKNFFGKKHSIKTKRKMSEMRKGSKGSNWKGGITSENKKIRNSIEYRLWREVVFARDNWTCQKYKIKGGNLHPHHIRNFSEYPELQFAIDNGITLSEKAHKEFHKIYGNKNNTKEQLLEFLLK